ncbi:helix-turn-helix transcriptional regulator [Gordonia sp. TBRC 11910]|uniref:Helix-turn-helix transcriptional regulator n=1 Tax=Gordonia asplenii TaxID=2725283 RepID=A0A848L150_9ACTN|nr:helix-turn-helix transcriptional regulator [Gordonia asplenii]NMO04516.1 helix-turn-helix transcriptional regulator [Gordonia asplenii]
MDSTDDELTGQRPSKPSDELGLEEALAERLRSEREYLGMSQDQVARVLGLPRAAVSAFETGRRKVSSGELARLAALYGTTPNRLLGSEGLVDDRTTQLFRATNKLSDHDKDEVLRFVEFLSNASHRPVDRP